MTESRTACAIARVAQISLATTLASRLSKTVVVTGRNHSRPNRRKRKSPGSLPKPSFCSSGENQLIKINGKVMAIAFMANAQHLTYRADLLKAAGLEPPKTYEDVLAAAQVMRDKGIITSPLGLNLKPGWDLGEEFVNMYLGYGGDFFAPGSAKLALDPVKATAALEMMKAIQISS